MVTAVATSSPACRLGRGLADRQWRCIRAAHVAHARLSRLPCCGCVSDCLCGCVVTEIVSAFGIGGILGPGCVRRPLFVPSMQTARNGIYRLRHWLPESSGRRRWPPDRAPSPRSGSSIYEVVDLILYLRARAVGKISVVSYSYGSAAVSQVFVRIVLVWLTHSARRWPGKRFDRHISAVAPMLQLTERPSPLRAYLGQFGRGYSTSRR